MTPLISVIIANYNSENYISEAIQSILKQSLADFELIIVDDKSTDNSLDIINEFVKSDSRIKVIALEKNSGVTYSRQIGLRNSKGSYIAILDSDDISLPQRFEFQVKAFEDNEDVVLVASDYGVIDEKGKFKKHKKVHKDQAVIKWHMTFGNCFAHSTIMFRRKTAMELGGYDLNIKRGLDMELSSKLLTKGKAYVVPQMLSYWRTYTKSMTKSVDKSELEKNYIASVQKSIANHLNENIDFDTAQAVFYNYKKPANDIETFKKALDLINIASNKYHKMYYEENINNLNTAILRHILKILDRNKKQEWWKKGESYWGESIKSCLGNIKITDILFKYFSKLSSRNIQTLVLYKLRRVI